MWKNRYWQSELWTLVFILIVTGLMGSLFHKAALFIAIIITVYLIWNLINLSRLFNWLYSSESKAALSAPGIWGEVFERIHRQRLKQKKDFKKLNAVISEIRDSTDALKEGAMIISNRGEIRWYNKSSAKLLGLKSNLDIGQRLFNLLRHPDFIEYESARDYGKPLNIPSPVDSELMLSISITPYNENQRLVIIRDVTEKYQLERVRQDFVANVSHELRTPLTVITGYLEMLDPEINPQLESVAKPLNMMHQQALNMRHLVDDLLLLSKLDSKVEVSECASIDINILLEAICTEATAFSGDKNQKIRVHSHTNAKLKASEKQLRSAFSNLVFNAVRYTPEGGNIDIYWQETKNCYILKVEDDGVGIEPHHIPRLTERFYRVDTGRSRSQGGTGLGLAIVKHVLELHNASLQIHSELGQGSSFSCIFPKQ